jgi:hypothetical protein
MLLCERLEIEAEPDPEPLDNVITIGERRALLELTDKTCRWPIGDPGQPNFRFCGRQTVTGPYCADHSRMAYQPPNLRSVKQRVTASAGRVRDRDGPQAKNPGSSAQKFQNSDEYNTPSTKVAGSKSRALLERLEAENKELRAAADELMLQIQILSAQLQVL